MDKIICDRCGERVFRRSISVGNLHKYDTSSKLAFIQRLMSLENVSLDVATCWAEHGLFEECSKKIRDCPQCGEQLRLGEQSCV